MSTDTTNARDRAKTLRQLMLDEMNMPSDVIDDFLAVIGEIEAQLDTDDKWLGAHALGTAITQICMIIVEEADNSAIEATKFVMSIITGLITSEGYIDRVERGVFDEKEGLL